MLLQVLPRESAEYREVLQRLMVARRDGVNKDTIGRNACDDSGGSAREGN